MDKIIIDWDETKKNLGYETKEPRRFSDVEILDFYAALEILD